MLNTQQQPVTDPKLFDRQRIEAAASTIWDKELKRVGGKQPAQYEAHPDGTATVTTFADYVFTRNAAGEVHLEYPTYDGLNTIETNYPLFITNGRFWQNVLLDSYLERLEKSLVEELHANHGGFDDLNYLRYHLHKLVWSLYGMRQWQLSRHFAKQLYRLYDPAVFKLVSRYASPSRRNSNTYNAALRLTHLNVPASIITMLLNVGTLRQAVLNAEQLDEVTATQLVKRYFDEEEAPRSLTGTNRRGLMSRGAWRYFLNMKPSSLHAIIHMAYRSSLLEVIAMLHQSGTTPRYTAVKHLAHMWLRIRHQNMNPDTTVFTQFIRAVHRATMKSRGIRAFITELDTEHQHVVDWLANNPIISNQQANLPLAWWLEQSNQWHADPANALRRNAVHRNEDQEMLAHLAPLFKRHEQERAELLASITQWRSGITSTTIDGVKVEALTTPSALEREGKQMHHCVGGYSLACQRGSSVIFSLSSTQGRSTLQLTYSNPIAGWHVQQHYAQQNTQPPATHKSIIPQLVKDFREAHGAPGPDPINALTTKQRLELTAARQEFERNKNAAPPPPATATPIADPIN